MRNNIKGALIALSGVFKPFQVGLMLHHLDVSAEPRILEEYNEVRYG